MGKVLWLSKVGYQQDFLCFFIIQDSLIEVDENGTLDLSMKKKREKARDSPVMPVLGDALFTPPEASLAKAAGLQISPAIYRVLYEQDAWDTPLNYSKTPAQQDKEVRQRQLFTLPFNGLSRWDALVSYTHRSCIYLIKIQ